MCARKAKTQVNKPQMEPGNKTITHKTQKEEINDEIELLLKTLKSRQKKKQTTNNKNQ
jgi:hypothetical protein